jgi:hypothetical protein
MVTCREHCISFVPARQILQSYAGVDKLVNCVLSEMMSLKNQCEGAAVTSF